jgi:hypothetical protein
LIDLHHRGLWDRDIGECLGISARSVCTWRRRLKARGIVFGKKRPEKTRVVAEPKPKGRFCFECGAGCVHVGSGDLIGSLFKCQHRENWVCQPCVSRAAKVKTSAELAIKEAELEAELDRKAELSLDKLRNNSDYYCLRPKCASPLSESLGTGHWGVL